MEMQLIKQGIVWAGAAHNSLTVLPSPVSLKSNSSPDSFMGSDD